MATHTSFKLNIVVIFSRALPHGPPLNSLRDSQPTQQQIFGSSWLTPWYQAGWNTKQNEMKNTNHLYIIFQVLKVLLIYKNLSDTATSSLICHSSSVYTLIFNISRYHFAQLFRTSFWIQHYWKNLSQIFLF